MMKQHQWDLLIAPCGMNCALCLAYQRDKKSCAGCWGENTNKSKGCISCVIRNCEKLASSETKFCYSCEKYPCTRLKQLDKRYRSRYKMSMLENLDSIRNNGISQFISDETEKWKCTNCGSFICVHRFGCLHCQS